MLPLQVVRAEETPTSKSALAVSPAIIESVLELGKPVPFTVQVANITNFPLPVKSFVRDFAVQSTELEKTERARLDSSQWFSIKDPDFILQPNQVRAVNGTITAPINAVPGGHYATIYFQPLVPHEVLSPSTAYMNSQVGTLAFLIIKGDIEQKASFDSGLQAPSVVQHGPIDFTFTLNNDGNVHLMPTGTLTLFDMFGHEAAKLKVEPGVILPESTKPFTATWDAANALGVYRAELDLQYGDNTLLPKQSVTVWVVPWVAIIISIVIVIAMTLLIIRTKGRWIRAWRSLFGRDMRLGR